MGKRLSFTALRLHEPGVLAQLLTRSYQSLVETFPEHWAAEGEKWNLFDAEAHQNPDVVGSCVFVSCLGNEPIGLGSFDPRECPSRGVVGQHCILPDHRKHGYGARQLEEIVRRLRTRGAGKVAVTTSEHPFFVPARELYLSFGFVESGRRDGGPDPDFRLVDYELSLDPPVESADEEELV